MNFHWNIIHRAVYSETRLQKMKISNSIICKVFGLQPEHLMYLLYTRSKASEVCNILSGIVKETINITLEGVIF